MAETSEEVIRRYLENAVAAERSFENLLDSFANADGQGAAADLFRQHAVMSRNHAEQLSLRLNQLGGSPSTTKGLLGHLFSTAARTAAAGQDDGQRPTRNLITAYAEANSNVAMYEALSVMAEAAGDSDTSTLAQAIQSEEKLAAEGLLRALPSLVGEAETR